MNGIDLTENQRRAAEAKASLLDRSFSFSNRDLLVAVALCCAVLGAWVTLGFFVAAPVAWLAVAALIYWGHRQRHRLARWTGWLLIGPATATLLFGLFAMLHGYGPQWFSARWPREVHGIAATADSDFRGARVYGHEYFLNEEHVWRQRVAANRLSAVTQKYADTTIPSIDVPDWFYGKFPILWRPGHSAKCRYFSNGTPDEHFGGHWSESRILMYDPDAGYLYGWQSIDF